MTQIVGIVNLTPDSFSGDGVSYSVQDILHIVDDFIKDGARIIDIGAESTRPGASLLSAQEEWSRIEPFMPELAQRNGKTGFSIDTRHPETAQKFLRYFSGKQSPLYVNCVSSHPDEAIFEVAKKHNAQLVLMHSVTVPADPKITIPEDEDAVETICSWAARMVRQYGRNIILDPGVGFGKTAKQSLAIIRNIARIKSAGARLMVGHSRKSFLTLFTDQNAQKRDPATLLFSYYLARQDVDYLRVHDVKNHVEMLKIKDVL